MLFYRSQKNRKYPRIRRINYRCDYEDTDDYSMRFLISGYEESICPKGVGCAGKASYVERNRAMIRESDVCVFYYDENYIPPRRKRGRESSSYQSPSGTALAFGYAQKCRKTVVNCFFKTDAKKVEATLANG